MTHDTIWGIDLGGTKVECAVLKSKNDHEILSRKRIPTEAHKGYEHIIHQIKTLVDLVADEVGHSPATLGIGTPGTFDPHTGLHKNSNSTALNGQPFKRDLQTALGIPLKMANDANCFALAEARMGAVQDVNPEAEVVFGVIMGTGVGGGVVINGQVINGSQGIGGEWGHNFLDASGGKCYCGKVGCVERVISGPALQRYYHEISGQQKTLKEIVDLEAKGDVHAKKTMDRLAEFFGKAISVVINILDPHVIVLGGGVSNLDILYTRGVEEVAKHIFNARFDTQIVRPKLGDSAGVFGAAFLVA